jgi:transcriptional regulator with XRE-family HTH domain
MENINISSSRFPGDRIKAERLRLGITSQAKAAERFGVERETWSRYETGKLEMGRDVYRRFLDAGADPGFILSGLREGEEHLTQPAQILRLRVMASCLGDELHRAKSSLPYEVFLATLDGLWLTYSTAAELDIDAIRRSVRVMLRK